jgi:eukaryotic-like serine/threonine-protein kinase
VANIDRIGKYKVLATLGSGAHSTILQVRREADSREYALKTVTIDDKEDLKFLEQAKHEFNVAQKLDHTNLIKIYCLESQKDWLFRVKKINLLIEYVNGKTLDQVPPMPMNKLMPVAALVAAGLVHMHRRGVFHADLKPGNIMLGKRGEVKIIDYGLAWIKGETKDRIQGTPEYMAPETVKSKIINERTDIYNFGATLYRLVTLKLPPSFAASSESVRMGEKAWKSMLKPVQELNANVPEAICDLTHRCMSYKPEDRPERMGNVYEELKQIADELGEVVEGGTDPGT